MDNIFVNKAFDNSIKAYLSLRNNYNEVIASSFLVSVFKTLACIYGEIDIINPYILRDEKALKQNIMKFGYSEGAYDNFKNNLLKYYEIEAENCNSNIKRANPYFIEVQKQLIDMFMIKKKNYKVSNEDETEFFKLLYTSKTTNPLKVSYNYLTALDIKMVENYFYEQRDKLEEKPEPPKKSNVLNIEAYEILNYSITDIANMDYESVDKLNENVYSFFKIDEEAENKGDLLNQAIDQYKKYNSRITTGNGYVDILLVMGVVVTGILLLAVGSFFIF